MSTLYYNNISDLQIFNPQCDMEARLELVWSRDADVINSVDGRQVLHPARVRLKLADKRR